MIPTQGYAVSAPSTPFHPFAFDRRDPGANDVVIEILYCGICHSDLHQVRDEWGSASYPMVPGHEIVGRVTAVGAAARRLRVGDLAGVGCMVDSCRACVYCRRGEEQFCVEGAAFTYNSHTPDGAPTYGGYSKHIVVDEAFVLAIAADADLPRVAPLLCAGITTYSPLKRANVGPGQRVGIVGLGGLGHVAVKLARSFGAEVALFTTSPKKRQDALALGAHEVIVSSDADAMAGQKGRFDFVLDTVSAPHDLNQLLDTLKPDGTLTLVGLPTTPPTIEPGKLVHRRRRLAGSLIGGIAETQEMLDYCAEHRIVADVELIAMQQLDAAYERLLASDVKYRFVIDLASLR
jgi:uncharacterized zinc-type alcohol dehydrogenase-like protein